MSRVILSVDCVVIAFETYTHLAVFVEFLKRARASLSRSFGESILFYDARHFSQSDMSIISYYKSAYCALEIEVVSNPPRLPFSCFHGSRLWVYLPSDYMMILSSLSRGSVTLEECRAPSFPDGYHYSFSGLIFRQDLPYLNSLIRLFKFIQYDSKK